MNQVNLKKYKDKVNELSEKELLLRKIYLKKFLTSKLNDNELKVLSFDKNLTDNDLLDLNNGLLYGPSLGYSEIDMPWLKYIDASYEVNKNNENLYKELINANKNHSKELAIEFFGSKITFGKMISEINNSIKAFKKLGVKKGDYVTIVAAGIPETVYAFYALVAMGATANMMGYYFDPKDMTSRINDCNSKYVIIMDKFYNDVIDAIDKSDIERKIIIPTLNSSPLKIFSKKIETKDNEIVWNDFIKFGKSETYDDVITNDNNLPVVMVYSSGTTGASKAIVLTNDSFQNSVNAYAYSGVVCDRGFKFYQIIPPWYSTGLSTSIHLPLVNGSSILMDPRFERDIFVKNIIKHKPNYAVAPTSMYEGFLDSKLSNKKYDLSFFKYPFEGGEALNKEVASKIEEVFKKHGCDSKLLVGYGQCECGATISTETPYTVHVDGNVGIPLPGVNIMITDENRNSLLIGERGEILVDTPSGMSGYFNNDDANDKYFYIDNQGKKWYCTGDIGKIDSYGNLFIYGRASDYSIINDKKIYNFDIESIVANNHNIKLCDVLTNNGMLACHIVFEDFISSSDYENIIMELRNEIYNTLGDCDFVPTLFKIRADFPHAKSGKRNVLELIDETNGFVDYGKYSNFKILEKDIF